MADDGTINLDESGNIGDYVIFSHCGKTMIGKLFPKMPKEQITGTEAADGSKSGAIQFVMIDDESDKVIVSTIIALARALDLDVIAEGVENSEQVSFLKEAQCNIVQGYLYSVPVSKHDADELLKSKENDGISRILVANE